MQFSRAPIHTHGRPAVHAGESAASCSCTVLRRRLVETRRAGGKFSGPARRPGEGGGGEAWQLPSGRGGQLLKAMTWWDGFVVALANPGFLIAALGGSIGALGHRRRVRPVDDLDQARRAAEQHPRRARVRCSRTSPAAIALYAHEAWRKYLTLIGPLATFGYWIGWSVVLSVNGLVAGALHPVRVLLVDDWTHAGAGFDLTLPIVLRQRPDPARLALQRLRRPAGRVVRLRHRRAAVHPGFVLMFLPYITGDWSSSNMTVERSARAAGWRS